MADDDEQSPPRGLLSILDTEEGRLQLDNLQFEKTVCDLYSEGRCILPRIKWVN
jgi:hypothetical protein